jgi:predicted Zn-dependent protease
MRLARSSERPNLPYRFSVVNDSTPNAFALPGGHIAVTRGLLVALDNETQLAAVLGHEIGHVTARHAAQGMQRGMIANIGMMVLAGVTSDLLLGPLVREGGQLAAGLMENSYSRDQESESDRLGIDYMVRSGYNPQGAVELQHKFLQMSQTEQNPTWLAGLFRTHPFSRERMTANEVYIAGRYSGVLQTAQLLAGQAAFQQGTARVRATKNGYELYDKAVAAEKAGDLSRAISLYEQAANAAPDQGLIHSGLGFVYLKKEDNKAARAAFERAVRQDPNYYRSRFGFGYTLLKLDGPRIAVPELESSMKILPTVEGAFFLAEAYEKTGEKAKAKNLYLQVAETDKQGKLGQTAAARARGL